MRKEAYAVGKYRAVAIAVAIATTLFVAVRSNIMLDVVVIFYCNKLKSATRNPPWLHQPPEASRRYKATARGGSKPNPAKSRHCHEQVPG